MNTNELTPGTITDTMHVGFRVTVEIVSRNVEVVNRHDEVTIYTVKYLGERKVLDFGQNWIINHGDIFTTRPMNINRALEWKAKGY